MRIYLVPRPCSSCQLVCLVLTKAAIADLERESKNTSSSQARLSADSFIPALGKRQADLQVLGQPDLEVFQDHTGKPCLKNSNQPPEQEDNQIKFQRNQVYQKRHNLQPEWHSLCYIKEFWQIDKLQLMYSYRSIYFWKIAGRVKKGKVTMRARRRVTCL